MAILEKLEYHPKIVEAVMQITAEESDMYPVTQQWVTTPVIGRTPEEDDKIERAAGANSADFQARAYVDINGVPSQLDLFTAIPRKSHMHRA